MVNLSISRLVAIIHKEFIQMKRDKLTFGMMVMVPLMQLILFGYAINMNPRNLPSVVVSAEQTSVTQQLIHSLNNTKYFDFLPSPTTEAQATQWLEQGKILFIVNIPPNFTHDLLRWNQEPNRQLDLQTPTVLITADGTDPTASVNAISAVEGLKNTFLEPLAKGPLAYLKTKPAPVNFIVHTKYNPNALTQYNIVPGLLGVVLTMTMVMITSLAITRERERGNMEYLLSTPALPLEVMVGKIIPYIMVGYVQVGIILAMAHFLFKVPMVGSLWLLLGAILPFIAANLSMGLTFSSVAKNQLQAVQLAFFFFLPSILLSGFMFPFFGMPRWAQYLGELLPLTHFLRIVRGIMLKGSGAYDVWLNTWPLLLFILFILLAGIKRFNRTLD